MPFEITNCLSVTQWTYSQLSEIVWSSCLIHPGGSRAVSTATLTVKSFRLLKHVMSKPKISHTCNLCNSSIRRSQAIDCWLLREGIRGTFCEPCPPTSAMGQMSHAFLNLCLAKNATLMSINSKIKWRPAHRCTNRRIVLITWRMSLIKCWAQIYSSSDLTRPTIHSTSGATIY